MAKYFLWLGIDHTEIYNEFRRRGSTAVCLSFLVAFLSACASPPEPPTQEELAAGRAADPPSDERTAQSGVIQYFGTSLKDPYSARYSFYKPVNSYLTAGGMRSFGWFMCGKINAKNSYGGYTGDEYFITYFNPRDGDTIITGSMGGKYPYVQRWCNSVYGNPNAKLFSDNSTQSTSSSLVKEFVGSGIVITQPFSVFEPWEIQWDAQGESFGIFVYSADGSLLGVANNLPEGGAGTGALTELRPLGLKPKFQLKPGRYYLKIVAIGDWEVRVVRVE